MEWHEKKSIIISVTVLLAFVVGIAHPLTLAGNTDTIYGDMQEQFYVATSDNLLCHSIPSKNENSGLKIVGFSGLKISANYTSASHKAEENCVGEELKQYIEYIESFPIRFRKEDLIFPFHYHR